MAGVAKAQVHDARVQANPRAMMATLHPAAAAAAAVTAAATTPPGGSVGTLRASSRSGDRVRRWATRLLRGHSTSCMLPAGASDSMIVSSKNGSILPPVLPPKQPRPKPVPPPRTSSCLSRPDSASVAASSSAGTPTTATAAAVAAAKSVRFGQVVRKDAIAEATIGLEMAANLALAFARDVRRGETCRVAAAAAKPATPAAAAAAAAMDGKNGQELTLQQFYQLFKYVDSGMASNRSSSALSQSESDRTTPYSSAATLPPGCLTAHTFRQKAAAAAASASAVVAEQQPNRPCSQTLRPSRSQEDDYDNLKSNAYHARTRSLPRSQSSKEAPLHPPPPPAHTAAAPQQRSLNEIISLINQILSHCDQQLAPDPRKDAKRYQRPVGASHSDTEETYFRQGANNARQDRNYDSLKTTKRSSHASSGGGGGGGHESYLASLSQRWQIEQYIANALSHLNGRDAAKWSSGSQVECWGSPERRSSIARDCEALKAGLQRALLRLDLRRTHRHPRAFQHHHWRITPAECNALFLCKVFIRTV